MKTINYLLVVAFMLSANLLLSIQEFDIRFEFDEIECNTRQACYLTQLRSADGQAWNLAGQNYRIFYDASMGSFVDGTAESLLDAALYSDILLTANIQNTDASGAQGDIPFKSTLSFLNYSVDLMNLTNGGVELPANGDWVSTTRLCFEVTEEVIDNGSECLTAIWARMGKTDGIATAFVEVSQWVEANSTTEAFANVYDDLDAEDGDDSCLSMFCGGGGNENTEDTCSDGIDNDEDGLVDCNDPSCGAVAPCVPDSKSFQLALDLRTIECSTGMVCYNVNLRSGPDDFTLGSQRYQLFYNSALGSFVSGSSLLGNEFQSLSLQSSTPVENVNATGVGDLPFEGDLGFINFTIQLTDEGIGSSVIVSSAEVTTTAELCFVLTDETINDGSVCFEATWARQGLTDPYNASMVEIDEWVSANSSVSVEGTNYGDLSSALGDDACFNLSCVGENETGDQQCNDGLDNDDDGLVDCNDPGCGSSSICQSQCTAQAPVLGGN